MNSDNALSDLEARYKEPFARWSSVCWANMVTAFLPTATEILKSQLNHHDTSLVIEAYLDLVAQGIGRGHFFPHKSDEFPNFFIFSWEVLIPKWILVPTTLEQKLDAMAKLWNLSVSLSQQPPWLESLLIASLSSESAFSDIGVELKKIESLIMQGTDGKLLSTLDPNALKYKYVEFDSCPYFLPDTVKFEAPGLISISGLKYENKELPAASFYVLTRPQYRVFPQTQNLPAPSRGEFSSFQILADTISKSIGLDCLDYAVNGPHFIAVFNGSQRLHIWTQS